MKKSIYSLGLIFSAVYFSACGDMNDLHNEFIVPGGITYPQKAEALTILEGRNRVRIEWLKGTDPKVVKARVYWNNYTDSVNVDIPAAGNIVSVDIDNIAEDSYTFVVKTFDAEGNVSVPTEATGKVYGALYETTISPRKLSTMKANEAADKVELDWVAANSAAVRFVLKYRTTSGDLHELAIPLDTMKTILTDYQPYGDFTTETYYLPTPTALDEFVAIENGIFPEQLVLADHSLFSVIDFDSEQSGDIATNILDNNVNTCWQSRWSGSVAPLPHYVIIDLGTSLDIGKIDLYRRNMPAYPDTKTVHLFLGDDPNPAALTWNQIGTLTFPTVGTDNLRTLDIPRGADTSGQYLKLYLDDSYRAPYVQIAEIYIYVR
ncbi:chitobiase [Bacteroidia bacterium]|nr:chitobiase [Bacteroidia bacterium]